MEGLGDNGQGSPRCDRHQALSYSPYNTNFPLPLYSTLPKIQVRFLQEHIFMHK